MGWRQRLTQAKVLAGIAHGSRAFAGPYQAALALTYRCNLQCLHCYFYSPLLPEPNYYDVRGGRLGVGPAPDPDELRTRRTTDMDRRLAATLIDELIGMGTCSFHFAGTGEPLVHPQAMELFARIKRAGLHCCMNTNGTLLDRERVDALVRMEFDELRVTTMAGTEEVYARTHPGCPPGAFGRLKEGLLALAERKSSGPRRPTLKLVCIVVRQNCEDLEDFVRLAQDVKADAALLYPVDDIDDPHLAPVVPTEAQAAALRQQLPELARSLQEHGLRHNLDRFRLIFRSRLDTRALYRAIPCYIGWLVTHIFPEGRVYACCRGYRSLGNVLQESVSTIWHGAAYEEFRRSAGRINRRGTPVPGCACFDCANTAPNLHVFRALHPFSRRLRALEREGGAAFGQESA